MGRNDTPAFGKRTRLWLWRSGRIARIEPFISMPRLKSVNPAATAAAGGAARDPGDSSPLGSLETPTVSNRRYDAPMAVESRYRSITKIPSGGCSGEKRIGIFHASGPGRGADGLAGGKAGGGCRPPRPVGRICGTGAKRFLRRGLNSDAAEPDPVGDASVAAAVVTKAKLEAPRL